MVEKSRRDGNCLPYRTIDTIKIKSKNPVVIPEELMAGFKEGEELVIIRDENSLILKQASSLSEKQKEDLEFARRYVTSSLSGQETRAAP